MNYWESGLDMNYGDDLYDSFVAYQTELIEQFNIMSEEYGFTTLDARQESRAIQRQLRREVTGYLESCHYPAPGSFNGK
jgi:dTMP kinase